MNINQERLASVFTTLCEIDSPSKQEGKVAESRIHWLTLRRESWQDPELNNSPEGRRGGRIQKSPAHLEEGEVAGSRTHRLR